MKKSNESSLKEVIDQLLDNYRLRDKLNEVTLSRAWETIMGPSISKRTHGISIKNETLVIKLTSAPLKHELLYQKSRILELMNKELDGEYLKEVIIE